MKQELIDHIASSKEVLSSLPKNNKKNKTKYMNEVLKLKEETNNNFSKLKDELIKRSKEFDYLKKSTDIDKLDKQISDLLSNIRYLNEYNSSYEKLGIDKILYDISNYSDDNLEFVNNKIKELIIKFQDASIVLKPTDFNYSPYATKYMQIVFKEFENINSVKVKENFEKIYWKSPSLIRDIVLNFRQLYFKNIKKFDIYVASIKEELLKKDKNQKKTLFKKIELIDPNDIINKYKKYKLQQDMYLLNDKYLIVEKFRNKQFKKADFDIQKIDKLYASFTNNVDKITESNILKLHYSVIEYKKYLSYKFIIDKVMTLYKDKDKYKNLSKIKMKDITKNEGILKKFNSKYNSCKDKKKQDKIYLDITNKVDELDKLYKEYDNDYFNEQILLKLSDDSSIKKLLLLVESHEISLIRILKENNSEITDNEIDTLYIELNDYLLSPYNTIINNLSISREYDIPAIISDKYKLMNININKDSLEESGLDSIIDNTKQIILYNIFNKMDFTLDQIDNNCKILEIIKDFEVDSK